MIELFDSKIFKYSKVRFLLLLCPVLFYACSQHIVPVVNNTSEDVVVNQEMIIKYGVTLRDSVATIVGRIKIGDEGYNTTCSEEDALSFLKKEGISLDADLIIISDEGFSYNNDNCYICSATLYKFNVSVSSEDIKSGDIYRYSDYNKFNSQVDKKRVALSLCSVTGVFFLGLLLIVF